ncbi:DNA replication protein psf1 [Ophidiomyces ophidiicola]|uniref:DNA replication protein psf1 n=1 Tax=Ophidiomyces ophidiicola TaxID=1387563 RepID=UPI0020C3D2A8|nr:DNA replication protein psf1 [Ophidiomyces ophidiicola]KAI1915823.1 DNA replication protein psf1 [Ophidiomyces ophidiicola]KAI1920907.1 DNA replication protein psf1 [Ophidiomyces ophidiicola]KAI1922153.1 DNA replication protein psf1 [Ophidiomyces ophidiicola]KAI1953782.1 DNA replication protein psf1 [Ophidiomyces ophidiicola]KAI1954808.1 DNA replication protein psf1 [Ophidiomyces ophidiicola]
MYGDLGNKLVQHAKRIQSLPHLPPYHSDIIRSLIREVHELNDNVTRLLLPYDQNGSQPFNPSSEPATACALLVNHLCMRRNKRCLLGYHRVRAEKIEELCWKGWDVMDYRQEQQQQQHLAETSTQAQGGSSSGSGNSLCPEEEDYLRKYGDMLLGYKGQWTDIDLTGSLEPPQDLFIDVRVLKDVGEIQMEYGSINLTKNSQFYVRLGDVEKLISQGYLMRMS